MTQETQPVFGIQRVYMKSASFEMPKGADVFLDQTAPAIELNLAVSSSVLADGIYEVVLRGTVASKTGDQTQYLVEVDQAGIFEIRNIPESDMQSVLEISCPSILTPYLRSQIADMLSRASLPVFHMPEMNWVAMQAQRVEQQKAA